MSPDQERAIRDALARFGDALIAALDDERVSDGIERLLSVEEASRLIGIGRSALYQRLSSGAIRSCRVGRRRLVPSSALREIADAQRVD